MSRVTRENIDPQVVVDDAPDRIQLQIWKKIGANGRSALAQSLRSQVLATKQQSIEAKYPEWTESQVRRAAARYFLGGKS